MISKLLLFVAPTLFLLSACDDFSSFTEKKPSVNDRCVALVKDRLKDPESAIFKNVSAFERPDGSLLVCKGEVNAKNGFGGYMGFKEFKLSDNSKDQIEF